MADALDSKSSAFTGVRVQLPPPAPCFLQIPTDRNFPMARLGADCHFFQSLENCPTFFPRVGNFAAAFSNPWTRFYAIIFHSALDGFFARTQNAKL